MYTKRIKFSRHKKQATTTEQRTKINHPKDPCHATRTKQHHWRYNEIPLTKSLDWIRNHCKSIPKSTHRTSSEAPAVIFAALNAQKLQKDAAEASVKPPLEAPFSSVFVFHPLRRCENSSRDESAKDAPNKIPKNVSQEGPWPGKSKYFATGYPQI